MTLAQFKYIGDKYNLFYDKEMLYFKPDTRRAQYVVALYTNGIAQVYTECVFNIDYEIESSGDCYGAVDVNSFENCIKEFWTNYKNTVIKLKKYKINKDFENENKARPSIHECVE